MRSASVLRMELKINKKNDCPHNDSGYYPSPCSRDISRIEGDPADSASQEERH